MEQTDALAIPTRANAPLKASRERAPAAPGEVLAIVCVGMILANIDLFIVNVGLPNIAQEFSHSSLEGLSWILNGYTITYASLLVFFGRVSERYRRNRSFLLGVAIFTVASAACAAANSVALLVAFRVAQAAGAALMTPTSLGLLLAVFAPERRGRAVRTWTAIGGFAAAVGPLVGGLLVTASWRWIFLVNVPIGLIALAIGWRRLPEIPGHDVQRPDPWAALLVTAGVASLIFGIVKVNDWGWGSARIIGSFAAAAFLLGGFVVQCLRSRNPFIDPALFRIRAFSGASLVMAPFAAAFGALLLSIVLWDQMVWGWPAIKIGVAMAPGPLLVPFVSLLFSTRLIARFGAAAVVAAGVVMFALGLIFWALVPGLEPSFGLSVLGMVPIGIGTGLTFPTLMGVSTASLPPSSFATGSGTINMIRQGAMAIGVAVLVALVGSPSTMAEHLSAFQRAWWVMAAITILGLIPTMLLLRSKISSRTRP